MPSIDVTGAAARLLANKSLVHASRCLYYCWLAISQGKVHYITGGADTAYNTWLAVPAAHQHTSRTVPKDMPAFLGKKRFSLAGDVIISRGDGTFVATDWPGSKQVGVCTLAQREAQTGRKFVGWASSMGGYTLTTTSTAGESGTPIDAEKVPDLGEEMKLITHPNGQPAMTDGAFVFLQIAASTMTELVPIYGPPIPVSAEAWQFTTDRVAEHVAWMNSLKSTGSSVTVQPILAGLTGTVTLTPAK